MGNNASNMKNNVAQSQLGIANANTKSYVDMANEIYRDVDKPDVTKNFRDVVYDPVGTAYPYDSPHRFGSDSNISEGIAYVEFICQDSSNLNKERYAVNHITPDHDCQCNCECVRKTADVTSDNDTALVYQLSPTSSEPTKKKNSATCQLKGGANDDTDDIFSETSDIDSDKNKKTKKIKKEKSDDSEEEEDDDDVLEFVDDDEEENNNNNNNNNNDDDDDDDEELENIEDETTENGLFLEQSDITSSDLYRMQSRLFDSETETENINSDIDFTEKVRDAMDRISKRKALFNSEDREILDMKSSTDRYSKKTYKKNSKYEL